MNGVVKIFTIIAITGLAATVLAPQAQTAKVLSAASSGITSWQKVAEGRG